MSEADNVLDIPKITKYPLVFLWGMVLRIFGRLVDGV